MLGHCNPAAHSLNTALYFVACRRILLIEQQRVLGEGWKSEKCASFSDFSGPVEVKDINVVMHYRPEMKVHSTFCVQHSIL